VFAWLWVKLGNRQPSVPQKFSLGLLFAGFSFLVMSLWFLSNAAAQAINAQIVKFYTPNTEMFYFGVIGAASLLLGLFLFLLAPKIQSYMKGVR
jgi:POT family proton-dependent oligopeptide transporter